MRHEQEHAAPRKPELAKWAVAARRDRQSYPTGLTWKSSFSESYPSYVLLPDRCKDLLDSMGCKLPDSRVGSWNVSQTAIITGQQHRSPCLHPGALMWLPHRGRRMYGREAVGLQGMHLSHEAWERLDVLIQRAGLASDRLFWDLAGNAFCTVSVLPMQVIAMLVLARYELGSMATRDMTRAAKRQRTFDEDVMCLGSG